MIEKFLNLSTGTKIAVIGVLVGFLSLLLDFAALFDKPQSAGDKGIVNVQQVADGGTVNITNGIPLEKYLQDLEKRGREIRQELIEENAKIDAHNAQRQQQLETQLVAVQTKLQNIESSYKDYIKELQERIKRLEALKGQLPDALIEQAIHALQNGDSDQADQLFAKVLEQAEAPIKVAAEASFQRANIAKENIEYHNALKHYERAAQLAPENTLYLNYYAVMLNDMGYVDKAIEYYEQGLASDLHTYGEDHPKVATDRNNLGLAWQDKGDLDKAIGYLEQALASDLKNYGEDHPKVAIDRNNLGSAWKEKGQLDKAIEYFEQALASDINTYGEDHPNVATYRNNLGLAWQDKGDLDKAIGYLEQALASGIKTYGEDHPKVAIRRNNLGLAWKDKGDLDKAIGYLEQALASDLKNYGEDHPEVAIGRNNLGSAWYSKGELNKAVNYLQLAFDGFKNAYGDEHPSTQTVKADLEFVQAERAQQLEAEK